MKAPTSDGRCLLEHCFISFLCSSGGEVPIEGDSGIREDGG